VIGATFGWICSPHGPWNDGSLWAPIGAIERSGLMADESVTAVKAAVTANLMSAYAGAGTLLAMFVTVASSGGLPNERLEALQSRCSWAARC
jgi:hypothetical protein